MSKVTPFDGSFNKSKYFYRMLIVVYVGLPVKSVYETLKFIAELETSVSELNKIKKRTRHF